MKTYKLYAVIMINEQISKASGSNMKDANPVMRAREFVHNLVKVHIEQYPSLMHEVIHKIEQLITLCT